MPTEEIATETILYSERLGDEKRIRAILTDWGTDEAAIELMLRDHRALEKKSRRALTNAALNYSITGRPQSGAQLLPHSMR